MGPINTTLIYDTCGADYLRHHPSHTSLLTFDYYNATNNRSWSGNIPVSYQFNLSFDFNKSNMSRNPVKFHKGQCVGNNSMKWRPLSCTGKPNENETIKCECDIRDNVTNMTLSYVICSDVQIPVKAIFFIETISAALVMMTLLFLILARLSKVTLPHFPILNQGDVRTNKFVVQSCICLSLLLMHVFSAITAAPRLVSDVKDCHKVVVGMHFTIFAAAFWLLNQGISVVVSVSGSFPMRISFKLLTKLQLLTGWGAPILIAILIWKFAKKHYLATNRFSFLITDNKVFEGEVYPPYSYCKINPKQLVAFCSTVSLLAVIVLINILIVTHVLITVHRISKNDAIRRHVHAADANVTNCKFATQLVKLAYWKTVGKALLLLLPVSTIPWLIWMFALFDDDNPKLVFAVSSGAQGIAVFLIFFILNSDDRKRVYISWKRSQFREYLC